MNIIKKSFSVSVKPTKNYQSIALTEGFEVVVDENFSEFDYEIEKQAIKDRLAVEAKKYLDSTTNVGNLDIDM